MINGIQNSAEETPILLFPTHYLGNFVLGLPWVLKVLSVRPQAPVVLDARFGPLARLIMPEDSRLILYPPGNGGRSALFQSTVALLEVSDGSERHRLAGNTGS